MSGFLETAAPVGQRTLDAFVQGASAGPSEVVDASEASQSELPTLGDWVEGSGGTPVELSLGDWHASQPSTSAGTWECDACTYADNAVGAPCCDVCGRTRGVPWGAAPREDEEGVVRCEKCDKMVAQEDRVEHMDWHLAVELQERERGPRVTAGKRQSTIDSFLIGAHKHRRLS